MRGDESIGRYPDGNSHVITMNVPTIARANITGSYAAVVEQPAPTGISELAADTGQPSLRYVAGRLDVRCDSRHDAARVDICNLAGLSLKAYTVSLADGHAALSLDGLSSGCYIARLTDGKGHTATCKFIRK